MQTTSTRLGNPLISHVIHGFSTWNWYRDGLVTISTRYGKITAQARNFSMHNKNIGITADNGKVYLLNEQSARHLIAAGSTMTKPELVTFALDFDLMIRAAIATKTSK